MKFLKDFIIVDAAYPPFKSGSFDTVLIYEVLEHLEFNKAKIIINECKKLEKILIVT